MKYGIAILLLLTACTAPQPTRTVSPAPSASPTVTRTPAPEPLRLYKAHPIPAVNEAGFTVVSFLEYQCYTDHFYGIVEGNTFWIKDDPQGYAECVAKGKQ